MTAGGGRYLASVVLDVDLSESPAYIGGSSLQPLAGRLLAGRTLACPPDIDKLKCLIARIAPAHVQVIYQIVYPEVELGTADTTITAPDGSVFRIQ